MAIRILLAMLLALPTAALTDEERAIAHVDWVFRLGDVLDGTDLLVSLEWDRESGTMESEPVPGEGVTMTTSTRPIRLSIVRPGRPSIAMDCTGEMAITSFDGDLRGRDDRSISFTCPSARPIGSPGAVDGRATLSGGPRRFSPPSLDLGDWFPQPSDIEFWPQGRAAPRFDRDTMTMMLPDGHIEIRRTNYPDEIEIGPGTWSPAGRRKLDRVGEARDATP